MADHKKSGGARKEKASPWKLGGLSIGQLGKRTWKAVDKDQAFDVAAALGYYFLLALFPMLIFLVSILTMFSSTTLVSTMLDKLSTTMPGDAYDLLRQQLGNIMQQSKGGLLTFGALGTIWAASSGVASLMDGLNRAYEVDETRSFIKKRLIALGLTFGLAALTILGAVMLVGSDQIAQLLYSVTGMTWMKTAGAVLGFIIGLTFMFVGLELVFYTGPNVKDQSWAWISPGSLVGVIIFVAVSFGFSQYLRFSNSYNATYGSIGGVIILMLWLYYLGLAIVLGGEINSEIARAALQHGNENAPKVAVEQEGSEKNTADKKAGDKKSPFKGGDKKSGSGQRDDGEVRGFYPEPGGYQPQAVFAFDDSKLSVQAKRRVAMRRLKRNEDAVEMRQSPPRGWAILKRPLVSLVYLGSIGFYVYQAFTKRTAGTP